jgi:hypothetical protein
MARKSAVIALNLPRRDETLSICLILTQFMPVDGCSLFNV